MPLYSFCFNEPRALRLQLWTAFDDALVSSNLTLGTVMFDVEDAPAVLPAYFDTWKEKMQVVVDMTSEDLSLLLPMLVRSRVLESKCVRISSRSS